MIDFKVFRGKAEQIIVDGAPNPRLVIEEGCWYLCTDTAELFLGVLSEKDELTLKQINRNTPVEPSVGPAGGIIDAYINEAGELLVVFSDGSEKSLGKVTGDITIPDEYVTEDELAAKGFITDISGLASIDYVNTEIAKVASGGTIDLTDYYTKEQTNDKIAKSVAGLATEQHVSDELAKLAIPTKTSELENDSNFLTEHQDLSKYALKSEIPADYVTKQEFQKAIEDIEIPEIDLTGYATQDFVITKIAEAEIGGQEVDLSKYATKDDLTKVEQKIPSLEGLATEEFVETQIKESVPTKVSDLENDKGYLTEHQDLSEYAKQTDLEGYTSKDTLAKTLSDYVNSDDLQTELSENYYDKETADKEFAKHEELADYYKKTEADDKFIDKGELSTELIKYATVASLSEVSSEVQTLADNLHDKVHTAEFSAYAEATSQALSALNTAIGTHTGQISAINGHLDSINQSLTPLVQQVYSLERTKADRSELSEISVEIAKKADLGAITEINVSLAEKLDVTDFNNTLQDYYKKNETYNQTEVDDLLKQLKAQVEGISKLNIKVLDYVPEDLTTEITEENVIYLVPTASELENSSYDEYLLIDDVPERIGSTNVSLAGYVKEEDLTNYVSKHYLAEQNYLKEIPSNYITETELATELASYYTAAQAEEVFVSPTELSTKLVSYLLASDAQSIYVSLAEYNTKVAELAGFIQALQNTKVENSELANYYTKSEIAKALEDTKAELNSSIAKVAKDLTLLDEAHSSDIAAIQQTITELNGTKADKAAVEDVRATVNDINTFTGPDNKKYKFAFRIDNGKPVIIYEELTEEVITE